MQVQRLDTLVDIPTIDDLPLNETKEEMLDDTQNSTPNAL